MGLTILAMSAQCECLHPEHHYRDIFDLDTPSDTSVGHQVWPRRPGVFIRNKPVLPSAAGAEHTYPGAIERELVVGQFGLVSPWVKSTSDAKLRSTKLVNACPETVSTSNNFRSVSLLCKLGTNFWDE